MDPSSERATFSVGNSSSSFRRFESTTAAPAAGDSGSSSTVSALERSFGDLDISPPPPPPPPPPSSHPPPPSPESIGIISRVIMERRQPHWQDELEKERRRNNARHTPAGLAAAAKRGERWQPWWKHYGAGSGGERGRAQQQRSSAAESSRVGTAGIAKKRQTRQALVPEVVARDMLLWVDGDGDGVQEGWRPVRGPWVTRGGLEFAQQRFEPYVDDEEDFEQSVGVEKFLKQDVEVMEEQEEEEEEDDDDDMDEEENVGGDQRTREDSVMGDD